MSLPRPIELPYPGDALALFRRLASSSWAGWLDSQGRGRFDILVAEPRITLVTRGAVTTVCRDGRCLDSAADPLELLRESLGPWRKPAHPELPFCGGALGYFSYDLARRWSALPAHAVDDMQLPEMAIGIYDWALIVDHDARRCRLAGQHQAALARAQQLLEKGAGRDVACAEYRVTAAAASDLSVADYDRLFQRIVHYLREGDCYQINLTQRFCTEAQGDPFTLYGELRRSNPAPFGAYLNLPFAQVLSASPERFLRVRGRQVETKPIKGTRPRSGGDASDRAQVEALRRSPKDRAENLMIVDLLRNDLGTCCVPGSVQVPLLFDVESFATVHHLVSTVTGTLQEGRDAIELLRNCFPGGSITGAPKRRAMAIIDELEKHRRGLYCGAIGYIGFDGAMDTNIVIRTLVQQGERICFGVGGGIVIDSSADAEYQECMDKAAALLRLLQQHRRQGST